MSWKESPFTGEGQHRRYRLYKGADVVETTGGNVESSSLAKRHERAAPPTDRPTATRDTPMLKLIQGVREFQSGVFPAQREMFAQLAEGQHPEALFITCSDSRIDPNLITNTDPGAIFVLRNIGNIVPPLGTKEDSEEAVIEATRTAAR